MRKEGCGRIGSAVVIEKKHPDSNRHLQAILFADVVGYSRMMTAAEETTINKVRQYIDEFEQRGKRFKGELIEVRGDGIFCLFGSVVNAVKFALDVQEVTRERNEKLPADQRVNFRMAIHLGDVLKERDRYVGDSVNITSRIEELAEEGGICISRAVYEQVKHKLNCEFEYVGSQLLKNIPDPVEVFRIRAEGGGATITASQRPPSRGVKSPDEPTARPTIALLPFRNLSGAPNEDYFSDGISEDIITNLSRFHNLSVIARNSVYVYKGKSLPLWQIGRELGARYVANGAVRLAGSRVRVNVELSDAESGHNLWVERYDRELGDIFDIQEEIANIVASAIVVQTEAAERRSGHIQVPALMESYVLVSEGHQKIFQYNRENNIEARRMYEGTLRSDPDDARAYAAISRTHCLDWRYSWTDSPERALESAYQFANQAVLIDPSDARGYGELGFVNLYRKEHDACLTAFERAVALNPNDADILSHMADALAHMGRSKEAIDLLGRAFRLNPFFPDQYLWYLGGAYFNLKQYKKAIDAVERMYNQTEGRRLLAASYAYLGDKEQARYQAEKVIEAYPNFSLDHWSNVQPDKYSEDTGHFVEGLGRAGLN